LVGRSDSTYPNLSLLGESDGQAGDELFADELKNIYYMENEIVENLPDMIQAATAPDLKQALSSNRRTRTPRGRTVARAVARGLVLTHSN
jgi:hypothetical protein